MKSPPDTASFQVLFFFNVLASGEHSQRKLFIDLGPIERVLTELTEYYVSHVDYFSHHCKDLPPRNKLFN